jgi:hypothetical protein
LKNISIFFVILVVIIAGCSTVPHFDRSDIKDQDNLLLNPSFELGQFDRDLLPLGWFSVVDDSGVIHWDQYNARTGNKSLKIRSRDDTVEIISESFPISPKNIYLISTYVKSLKPKHTSMKFAFMAFNKKGRKVNYFYDMSYPDSSWTEMSLRTGFLDDSARYARVIIILPEAAGTDFWIDDVECFIAHNFKK